MNFQTSTLILGQCLAPQRLLKYVLTFFFLILGRSDPGVESDTSDSRDGPNSPFTVLKKADVELLVGGKKKVYSVVIKVLPTDDMERHTSRRKFSDLLKFSKEVQVYCQALRCMVR